MLLRFSGLGLILLLAACTKEVEKPVLTPAAKTQVESDRDAREVVRDAVESAEFQLSKLETCNLAIEESFSGKEYKEYRHRASCSCYGSWNGSCDKDLKTLKSFVQWSQNKNLSSPQQPNSHYNRYQAIITAAKTALNELERNKASMIAKKELEKVKQEPERSLKEQRVLKTLSEIESDAQSLSVVLGIPITLDNSLKGLSEYEISKYSSRLKGYLLDPTDLKELVSTSIVTHLVLGQDWNHRSDGSLEIHFKFENLKQWYLKTRTEIEEAKRGVLRLAIEFGVHLYWEKLSMGNFVDLTKIILELARENKLPVKNLYLGAEICEDRAEAWKTSDGKPVPGRLVRSYYEEDCLTSPVR